ncbi:MAG TPA: hypothetical protein VFT24_03375 [Vicinamibacterales bacterium]|nr:hypothetical protein [Vicinamibacterales bacterium]
MRSSLAAALLLLAWSCSEPPPHPASSQPAPPLPAPAPVASEAATLTAAPRLQIRGTSFVQGESSFEWRGITAFRLLEQIARGREGEAIAYLDWAGAQKVTVVRVLTMAKHLFELNPGDGLRALPRLLALASERRLIVEVVALADTAALQPDLSQHVKAVATIAAAHPNAVVEIANEPWHPTQDPRLHDPAFVRALADLVPGQVPVALGSIEGGDGYAAAGRYATWHSPRSNDADNWGHVLALADGAALLRKWQKPVVSDEPVGAAEALIPGRRDNDPRRFAAAAAMTLLAGPGATFHYEGGLQARIPSGRELECFQAWSQGLDAMASMPAGGRFVANDDLTSTAGVSGARAVFGRLYDKEVWVILVDPADPRIEWKAPWREASRVTLPGVVVAVGRV